MSEALTKRNILYIGDDNGFWKEIHYRFLKGYEHLEWNFVSLTPDKECLAQTYFPQLIELDPTIIYIDFTFDSKYLSILSNLVSYDENFKKRALVGLVEDKEDIKELLSVGLDFVFVKGGEFHDIIYAPMLLILPNIVKKPDFAKGRVDREIDLTEDFRMGYVSPTSIHLEGNYKFAKGESVTLETELPNNLVQSKEYKIEDTGKTNLYYNYRYTYDCEIKFIDDPNLANEEFELSLMRVTDPKEKAKLSEKAFAERKEKINDYEQRIKVNRKKFSSWVEDQMELGERKPTKVLIVDKNLSTLRRSDAAAIDSHFYALRVQTELDSDLEIIERIRPSILAVQLFDQFDFKHQNILGECINARINGVTSVDDEEKFDEEEKLKREIFADLPNLENQYLSLISKIVNKVKSIEGYSPILLFFRCYFKTSKSLQENYQYPLIVTHNSSISMDIITNMATVFQKKQDDKLEKILKGKLTLLKAREPKKYQRFTTKDLEERRYYIKKKSGLSYVSHKVSIHLDLITESELAFRCKTHLYSKTYRLNFPLDLSIRIIPFDENNLFIQDKEFKIYKAAIHSIDENDKKELRRYVNEVFFEPITEKRKAEAEEFRTLNEQVAASLEKDDFENPEDSEDENES